MKIKHFLFAILIGFVFITACSDDKEPPMCDPPLSENLEGSVWRTDIGEGTGFLELKFLTKATGEHSSGSDSFRDYVYEFSYSCDNSNISIQLPNSFNMTGQISADTMTLLNQSEVFQGFWTDTYYRIK